MKLINKITIKYFRSLHTVDIKKCSSINVVSGRNDVGKSNVIKALNLFFNGQVDWGSAYDFYDNFSKKRLSEVRKESVKGRQFISIKLEIIRPKNYKGSLPEKFTVERRWYRESKTFEQTNNLQALEKAGKLPSTLTSAQRSLATFLNKVHFEYVPAIRDGAYVSELLGRLQKSVLDITINQNADLLQTANNLAEHIEGQIGDLKKDFESATQIETSIRPPSTISSLFQSFLVSTETDDGVVPLKFRGDGLQCRYVASVLHYIATNSSDFYIWGYEEPEIALEYSHVSQMACDFHERYSNCAQIFLTTHSPAFISLESDDVSCYRASQDNSETVIANVAINIDLDNRQKLKEELGILEIQKEVHEYYSSELEKLRQLNERVFELESELNNSHQPIVVVEGKTDKNIFIAAAKKIFDENSPFAVRACSNTEGGGGAGQLAKLIETIHPEDGRVAVAIFDNDKEGQDSFEGLSKNFTDVNAETPFKRHKNGLAYAMLLPEPPFRAGFAQAKNLCIEYMFENQVLETTFASGRKLEIKNPPINLNIGGVSQPDLLDSIPIQACQKKIGAGKNEFSVEIVPMLDKNSFRAFQPLFDQIVAIINA